MDHLASTGLDLVAINLPDGPNFSGALKAHFPKALSEKFSDAIAKHPLKRKIISTYIANTRVNRTGATFVNFLAAEAGATAADVALAYTSGREIFVLKALWDQIDAVDHHVLIALQLDLSSKPTTCAGCCGTPAHKVQTS